MTSEFWVGPHDDPDRVRLGPAVASGAEGVLYRGTLESERSPIDVAVKMLQPGHLDRLAEWTLRWREQVELLQGSELPGLVNVRGGFVGPLPHSQDNSDPSTSSLYLLMDWVEGLSLDRWARSLDDPEPEQLLLALLPVAVALDMLHSGAATAGVVVVHRDVKPANILIRPGGDTVLVDIGSVRGLAEDGRRSGVVGTAGYIAPEVRSDGEYGAAADRYSLGAVAFFLLTGSEPPVEATTDDLRQRLAESPIVEGRPDVVDHVLAMLDVDPGSRPAPLANWVAQLRRSSLVALSGDVGLPPMAPGRHPSHAVADGEAVRRRPKRRLIAFVIIPALLLLTAIVGARALSLGQGRARSIRTASPSSVTSTTADPTTTVATAVSSIPPQSPKTAPGPTLPSTVGGGPSAKHTTSSAFSPLDHIRIGQVRVDLNLALPPEASSLLVASNDNGVPVLRYQGDPGVEIVVRDERVAVIIVSSRQSYFDTAEVASGVSTTTIETNMPGVQTGTFRASSALYSQLDAGTAYFVQNYKCDIATPVPTPLVSYIVVIGLNAESSVPPYWGEQCSGRD